MYGNAKAGDALLELTDLCTEQGFEVIAAATFIGVWGAMAGMPDQTIETTGRLLGLPLMFLFGFKGYTMVQDSGGNNVTAAFAAL